MTDFAKVSFNNNTFIVNQKLLPINREESYYFSFFDRDTIEHDLNTSSKGGRGKTLLYSLNNLDLVLRHYKRGGLIGKIIDDNFFCFEPHMHRAFDEFELLSKMISLGLPVPEPVIAREINYGLYIKQDIVIKRLIGYEDLANVINKRSLSENEFLKIGSTIKKFFDAGIYHTDLNIRNILINDQSDVYLIDFDKCFRTKLTDKNRSDIISRLFRSFNKEQTVHSEKTIKFYPTQFKILENEALKKS